MSLPSKKTYRTSITEKLRDQIREEAALYDDPRFLELGCDQGYTSLTVCDAYSQVVALDISKERIKLARANAERHGSGENVEFRVETSTKMGEDHFDVVLIDALHTYEGVREDFAQVLHKNTAKLYTVFFHDYWRLDFGVHRYINQVFRDNEFDFVGESATWQPDQEITQKRQDSEAVRVRLNPVLIKSALERLPGPDPVPLTLRGRLLRLFQMSRD